MALVLWHPRLMGASKFNLQGGQNLNVGNNPALDASLVDDLSVLTSSTDKVWHVQIVLTASFYNSQARISRSHIQA